MHSSPRSIPNNYVNQVMLTEFRHMKISVQNCAEQSGLCFEMNSVINIQYNAAHLCFIQPLFKTALGNACGLVGAFS